MALLLCISIPARFPDRLRYGARLLHTSNPNLAQNVFIMFNKGLKCFFQRFFVFFWMLLGAPQCIVQPALHLQ